MNTKIFKPTMLALAGAMALGVGVVHADPVDNDNYLLCTYKGSTQLTTPSGTSASCWLTLTMKVNCDGDHFHIVAAGSSPGQSPNCNALYLGNMPWGGNLPGILAGAGSIDTNHSGIFPYSVINGASFTPEAGGVVTGVSIAGTATTDFACGAGLVTTPDVVEVTGSGNFGPMMGSYSTFNAEELRRLSCTEVSI